MIPVNQTIFTVEEGDCYRACIASLLHLPLEQVPNFSTAEDMSQSQFQAARAWLCRRDLTLLAIKIGSIDMLMAGLFRGTVPHEVPYILVGQSPRGSLHAVIGIDGRIMHDPNPAGGGVAGIPPAGSLYVQWLLPLHPELVHP